MKRFLIIPIIALGVSACSSIERPQIAEELVYSSSSDRPAWTMGSAQIDGENLIATGLSHRHSTERQAREAAQLNASASAAAFLAQQSSKNMSSSVTANSTASSTIDEAVSIANSESLSAKAILSHVSVDETYIEQWNGADGSFFRAFTKISMPLKKARSLIR